MKVLHYVPRFSVLSETFIYDQIIALSQLKVENQIITSKRILANERPFDNIKVLPLRNIISNRVTQKLAFGFEWLAWFIPYQKWQKEIKKFQPDIIHCHTGNAAKTLLHIKKKLQLDIPILISLHGSDVTMEPVLKPNYKQWLMKAGEDPSILWTVPSDFLKLKAQKTLNLHSDKLIVVNNGFNANFLNYKSKTPLLREGKVAIQVLSIGRFIECKGQKYLIEALSIIKELENKSDVLKNINITLTLLGSGPKQEACKALAKSLGLDKHVIFIDCVTHEHVVELMSEHDIYVQPSVIDDVTLQEESFGVAALEALASGLPVIVTDCGGLPEVVNNIPDKYAKIIKQKSSLDLSQAILALVKKNERLPTNLKQEIQNKFSMITNCQKVERLYRSLIV